MMKPSQRLSQAPDAQELCVVEIEANAAQEQADVATSLCLRSAPFQQRP